MRKRDLLKAGSLILAPRSCRVHRHRRQKRPSLCSKETYVCKRDLVCAQKRPLMCAKQTYYTRKRDLLHPQKRPITHAKETYHIRKRDLLYTQKRPTGIPKVGKHVAGLLCHIIITYLKSENTSQVSPSVPGRRLDTISLVKWLAKLLMSARLFTCMMM